MHFAMYYLCFFLYAFIECIHLLDFLLYPRGESNPYLKFRKLLFYPLNYKGGLSSCVF